MNGNPPPITVVVVDDSSVQRRFLRAILEAVGGFEVVGEARDGREAVTLVERLRPAIVLMDLDLPIMNGIEAIERIMGSCPTPIVVHSAFVEGMDSDNAMAATAAGAVDIVAKRPPAAVGGLDAFAAELTRRLLVASRVRVITHPRGRLRSGGHQVGPADRVVPVPGRQPLAVAEPPSQAPAEAGPVRLVVIGASTGGPQALATVLPELPADFAPAVLVVQHMADGFLEGLAQWLDGLCSLPVEVGRTGRRLLPGTVTIAPGGHNLLVHDQLRVVCAVPPATQFHVPGIDATFGSVAASLGSAAIGVLLTGMGRDGAVGLKAMRDRGATTLGQDEATSAVWGMPQAARELGAVCAELALPAIAPALLELTGGAARVRT